MEGRQPPEARGDRQLGRYEIVRRLGEGGMAVVYLAQQVDLDRLVALKMLRRPDRPDPHWASRFLRESRLGGSLKHPNIVTVLDYVEAGGTPYIAMEYVERGSLRPYVGQVTLAQAALILQDVLAGLAHAERRGVVHRDLKPENLLVTEEGRIKVADFGIAKVTTELSASTLQTAAGLTVGTPAYMAPEQALAREDIGPWTDLYAVGCIAYELVTGRPPFGGTGDPVALMVRHVTEPIPPAIALNARLDPDLSDWIDALLVKDPSRRVQGARDAWEVLEEIVLSQLGPRWLRTATLPELPAVAALVEPAAFHSRLVDTSAVAAKLESAAGQAFAPPPSDVAPGGGAAMDAPAAPETAPPPPAVAPRGEAAADAPAPHEAAPRGEIAAEPSAWAGAAPGGEAGPEPAEAGLQLAAPAPARGRRRVVPVLAAAVVVLLAVAAAAVAVVLPRGGGSEAPRARVTPTTATATATTAPTPLEAGSLSVQLPGGWTPRGSAELPGFELSGAAAGGPTSDGAGSVVIGMAPVEGATPRLLPEALARTAPVPATEQLADGLHAYRYDGLTLEDGQPAVVYVVPTAAGVATVACRAPAADEGFDAACAGVAKSLAIHGTNVFAAGPSADYAAAVKTVVADVNDAQDAAMTSMRDAADPGAQARAAANLRRAIVAAAKPLNSLELSPADRAPNAALTSALASLADRYGSLAAAARTGRRDRYANAITAVER
ncbi:MAG TPA: serine/threonine-protein kinase, partial [Solirubrobacter sp.]|nr:serine/threonine-protein kinase [Solirubrobacter sp.]